SQTGRGRLDYGHESFDLLDTFAQFGLERFAFLLAHFFELIERLVHGPVHGRGHTFVDTIAGGLQGAGNASDDVDVELAGDVEVLLQLFQRADVTSDQRSIDLVSDLRHALHADGDVDATTRKPRRDPFLDRRFESSEL